MIDRFQDRVAVVTGGASGIGRAAVLRLLQEGATDVVEHHIDPVGTRRLQSSPVVVGAVVDRGVETELITQPCRRMDTVSGAWASRVPSAMAHHSAVSRAAITP